MINAVVTPTVFRMILQALGHHLSPGGDATQYTLIVADVASRREGPR